MVNGSSAATRLPNARIRSTSVTGIAMLSASARSLATWFVTSVPTPSGPPARTRIVPLSVATSSIRVLAVRADASSSPATCAVIKPPVPSVLRSAGAWLVQYEFTPVTSACAVTVCVTAVAAAATAGSSTDRPGFVGDTRKTRLVWPPKF